MSFFFPVPPSTPFSLRYRENGAIEAFNIKNKGFETALLKFIGILTIKFGFDRNLEFVSTIDLSPTGEAGTDVVSAVFVAFGCEEILVSKCGAGTDDAHVTDKNVPNLRKLIQG